jgi:hypothetical protein
MRETGALTGIDSKKDGMTDKRHTLQAGYIEYRCALSVQTGRFQLHHQMSPNGDSMAYVHEHPSICLEATSETTAKILNRVSNREIPEQEAGMVTSLLPMFYEITSV